MSEVREYELILMLDPEVGESDRDALAKSAADRIEKAGEMRHAEPWGLRKLAYEIDKRSEADYRFFRFTGEQALLDELDHNLKITDGILRFRIFRVDPRSPIVGAPEEWTPPKRREDGDRRPRRDDDYSDHDDSDADPGPRDAEPASTAAESE